MIYKSGPREAARSYRHISVATGMYSILARLILDTLRGPINAVLSDAQARCRRGYTTSQQGLRCGMQMLIETVTCPEAAKQHKSEQKALQ